MKPRKNFTILSSKEEKSPIDAKSIEIYPYFCFRKPYIYELETVDIK